MSRIILTDILGMKSTKLSSCASQIFYARIFYFHTKKFRLPFQFWHCFYRFRTDSDQLADVKIQDMQSLKGKKILSLKLFPLHCALFDEVSALHTFYLKASLSRFKQIKFILLNRNWVQQQQCTFCSTTIHFFVHWKEAIFKMLSENQIMSLLSPSKLETNVSVNLVCFAYYTRW